VEDADLPGTDHYFSERPRSVHRRRELRFLYRGEVMTFETDAGVFASEALDPGTALLIQALDPAPEATVLDLGCGWGAIGLAAARATPKGRVVLTDVNKRAILLARKNARRNGIQNVEVRPGPVYAPVADERFDLIASNPPFHVGRETVLTILEQAPAHLTPEGRILVVGKGSQGIQFYQGWLAAHWGADRVAVRIRGSGYRVLEARPPSR
jgi:16S rRNA (guanine1207-N2)-methyltransferase